MFVRDRKLAGRYTWPFMITDLDQIMLITWHLRLGRFFKTQYNIGKERKLTFKCALHYRKSSITFWKTWKIMATKVSLSAQSFGPELQVSNLVQ